MPDDHDVVYSRRRKPPISKAVVILVSIVLAVAILAWRQGRLQLEDLYYLIVLIPAIIIHEVAHGVVAKWFGDTTAQDAGRLSANPLRHVDPLGTIIIPAALILSGSGLAFGYAKPVPVDVSHMTKNKAMAVSLAGPGVNVLLAALTVVVLTAPLLLPDVVTTLVFYFGVANVVLAVFNSIPIPPLDGSAVIERFLPYRYMGRYLAFRRWSVFLLLGLMLVAGGLLTAILTPFVRLYIGLLA